MAYKEQFKDIQRLMYAERSFLTMVIPNVKPFILTMVLFGILQEMFYIGYLVSWKIIYADYFQNRNMMSISLVSLVVLDFFTFAVNRDYD